MKKDIIFTLERSVRITPVRGNSKVQVSTDGEVQITNVLPRLPRVRRIVEASTFYGTLTHSPKCLFRTVRITLPFEEASEKNFHTHLTHLFKVSKLNIMFN